jgi:RNA polymerase sigma-70 factor (ECF subfamily)
MDHELAAVNPPPRAGQEPSDEEIVGRIRSGEGRLFEVLMRRYNQRLFRVARVIVRDDGEAEDVMQQAYVNAYSHLDQFQGRARFATWLTRIAVHEASARRRRRLRNPTLDDPEAVEAARPARPAGRAPELDPEQRALGAELRRAIEAAIETLPEGQRTVFVLREVEGLSTQETAECLAVTPEVVKTRLSRARAHLRAELLKRAGLAAPHIYSFHLSRCDRIVEGVLARLSAPPGVPLV